jgi:signal transduction histidine kinase
MLKINSEILYTIVFGSVLVITLGIFIIIFLLQYQKKRFNHKQEIIQLQQSIQETLLQSQLEIKEQTLQHISYELHDNLGQVASLIKINLNTLQLEDTAKAAGKIEDTKELTRQLIGDLKALSISLNSDRLQQTGLSNALQQEVERLNKTGQFIATYSPPEYTPVLDSNKTIILYRMVQEVLNNMVKHSGAQHISVLFTASENLITLALSDDGAGFDIAEKMNSGGAGLQNLQNRAKLIQAQLTIQSSPGTGTHVQIELPL